MRRFGRAFLTTSAVLVLLVNLVAIILYGRQFYACEQGGVDSFVDHYTATAAELNFCQTTGDRGGEALLVINLFIVALLVFFWFVARYVFRQSVHS